MKRFLSIVMVVVGLALAAISVGKYFWSGHAQRLARDQWLSQGSADGEAGSLSPHRPNHPAFARLFVPRLHAERFVLANASDSNLDRGPAWLIQTSRPGQKGNCVIAGHRDTHFGFLKHIRRGDSITVEHGRRTYVYRVTSLHVVKPSHTRLLQPSDEPVLTLVTCYPFSFVGSAPKRFLVRAELVPPGDLSTHR